MDKPIFNVYFYEKMNPYKKNWNCQQINWSWKDLNQKMSFFKTPLNLISFKKTMHTIGAQVLSLSEMIEDFLFSKNNWYVHSLNDEYGEGSFISTAFKEILWMWANLQNDQNMTSVLFCHVIWRKHFLSKLQSKLESKKQEMQLTGI